MKTKQRIIAAWHTSNSEQAQGVTSYWAFLGMRSDEFDRFLHTLGIPADEWRHLVDSCDNWRLRYDEIFEKAKAEGVAL